MAFQFFDRSLRLPSSAADVAQRVSGTHDQWAMTDAERGTLRSLLSVLRPQCAIEVGVFRAGSLAILSEFCQKVYALDIDPYCEATYAKQFPNVQFITGPSETTLPELIDRLQQEGERLGFVLIDADHTSEGIRRDVESVLRYRPTCPLYLVMHDSFNPGCRSGMRDAPWAANPHVHLVELDFVPGRFVTQEEKNHHQMWCGFGLAVLLPERRVGNVILRENESLMYRTALRHSVYHSDASWNPFYSVPRGVRRVRGKVGRVLRARAPRTFKALRLLYATRRAG